jgi:hypothetical protein
MQRESGRDPAKMIVKYGSVQKRRKRLLKIGSISGNRNDDEDKDDHDDHDDDDEWKGRRRQRGTRK